MSTAIIEITGRDLAVMQTLFECRIMTLKHAAILHFEGRIEAATKRMSRLKQAGLIAERPRRPHHPSILFLGKRAFELLEERGLLNRYPPLVWSDLQKRARVSDMTLRHELAVMDVRCAITAALARQSRYRLIEFSTWPLLHTFQARPSPNAAAITVRPDGFLRIFEGLPDGEAFENTCFLEVDRSTEVLQRLITRSLCYRQFYASGGLAFWNGRSRDEFKEFPFRVLIIVPNAERRNNLAARLLQITPPILSQVWLGIMEHVIADPLGPVWITPADYRNAISGTNFEVPRTVNDTIYRRQPEREDHVERTIRKHILLTG